MSLPYYGGTPLACGRIIARDSRSIHRGFQRVDSKFLLLGTPSSAGAAYAHCILQKCKEWPEIASVGCAKRRNIASTQIADSYKRAATPFKSLSDEICQ